MNNKKELVVKYLDQAVKEAVERMEKLLKAKIIFLNDEDSAITIALEKDSTQKLIISFKKKVPVFQNIGGGAIYNLSSFTKKNSEYLNALYNQYQTLKYARSIVNKYPLKDNILEEKQEQQSIFDGDFGAEGNLGSL